MITVKHDGAGYRVGVSAPGTGWRGFSVRAKTLFEVHRAVDHYYGFGCPTEDNPDCPLCRSSRGEEVRRVQVA